MSMKRVKDFNGKIIKDILWHSIGDDVLEILFTDGSSLRIESYDFEMYMSGLRLDNKSFEFWDSEAEE